MPDERGWMWVGRSPPLATVFNRRGCTDRGSGGLPRDCSEFEGLIDVLERHMGDAWDPVDEILRPALIQSVDRQTPNPELDHPHARLGDLDRLPEATPLRAWLGQIVEREYVEGSVGRFTLSEGPGAFALHSSSPDPAWMLVRTRAVR